MTELQAIIRNFKIVGAANNITPFGEGMINSTYRVTLKDADRQYVLQKINHNIFKDVDMLQNNIKRITDHIRHKLEEAGETDVDRKTLTLISSNLWRI